MKFPDTVYAPDVQKRKAKLARRRSRLVWPDNVLDVAAQVRVEARVALIGSVRDYWARYRRADTAEDRDRLRSYIRAKITAARCLAL